VEGGEQFARGAFDHGRRGEEGKLATEVTENTEKGQLPV
jgi:hypothetical protein